MTIVMLWFSCSWEFWRPAALSESPSYTGWKCPNLGRRP